MSPAPYPGRRGQLPGGDTPENCRQRHPRQQRETTLWLATAIGQPTTAQKSTPDLPATETVLCVVADYFVEMA